MSRNHFCGHEVIGAYLLQKDGTCSSAAIDFDNHGREAITEPSDSPVAIAARVASVAEEFGVEVLVERSGGGAGAHAWVFFLQPIPADLARKLLFGILVKANVPNPENVEIFPKQSSVSDDGLGNLIALPFQGPEKVARCCSVFLDEDTFAPTEVVESLLRIRRSKVVPAVVQAAVGKMEAEGVYERTKWSAKKKRPPKGWMRSEETGSSGTEFPMVDKPIDAIYAGCAALRRLRDCRGDSKHGLGHDERLALAGVMKGLPGGREEIHMVLSACDDYEAGVTDYQVESLRHAAPLCSTLQDWGVCDGECANIRAREGRSPVAFAYRKRGYRPQDTTAQQRFFARFGATDED